MSAKVIHLNLLQASERVSSSPVRLKVILPIISAVAFVAVLVWWGFLQAELWVVSRNESDLRAQLSSDTTDWKKVAAVHEKLKTREAELAQLDGYLSARLTWGETLAELAQKMPAGIQLTSIEIPPPPPQVLTPPPGVKTPPLLGPTTSVERVLFRLAGRVSQESQLFALLNAITNSPVMTTNLIITSAQSLPKGEEMSPRMRHFGQESTPDSSGKRAISFDIEYRTPGRNFAP